jgi:hypothetical protein
MTLGDLAKGGTAALVIGAHLAVFLPILFNILVGVLIGVCVALLLDAIVNRFGDEIFNDVPVMQAIGPRGKRFANRPDGSPSAAELTVPFVRPQGNGLYHLTYDWAIVNQ